MELRHTAATGTATVVVVVVVVVPAARVRCKWRESPPQARLSSAAANLWPLQMFVVSLRDVKSRADSMVPYTGIRSLCAATAEHRAPTAELMR